MITPMCRSSASHRLIWHRRITLLDKQRAERYLFINARSGCVGARHRPGILQTNTLAAGLRAWVEPGEDRRAANRRLLRDIVDSKPDTG